MDAIVAAAISLADAAGLEAVTMRRLARVLGVAPMTLYTYVPGKAEVLDLMLDQVYRQMPPGEPAADAAGGAPWRARLEAVASANRALFAAHPWAATVSTVRPPLGPGLLAKYERELGALDGLGLDDVERDAALTFLLEFVRGAALAAAASRATARESAMSDRRWWEANAPLLARMVDATAYPTATRVGAAAGAAYGAAFSPEHAYAFGLRCVLDGLGALIERRRRG